MEPACVLFPFDAITFGSSADVNVESTETISSILLYNICTRTDEQGSVVATYEEAEAYSATIESNPDKRKCGNCW